MIIKPAYYLLLLFILPIFLFGQGNKSYSQVAFDFELPSLKLSAQADKAFQNGNYALAATLWDSVHTSGYGNCATYFNTGNAYFRLHVPIKAILNYERALRFCKGKTEVYTNLQMAAQNIPDYIAPETPNVLTRISASISANIWGLAALIFTNLSLFLFYQYKYKGKQKVYSYMLLCGLFSLLLLVGYYQSADIPKKDKTALVMQDSIALKAEPGSTHKTIGKLNVGEKIIVKEELGAWWNVESNEGEGWVEQKSVEKIME